MSPGWDDEKPDVIVVGILSCSSNGEEVVITKDGKILRVYNGIGIDRYGNRYKV